MPECCNCKVLESTVRVQKLFDWLIVMVGHCRRRYVLKYKLGNEARKVVPLDRDGGGVV